MRTIHYYVHPGNFETFMEEYAKQLRVSFDTDSRYVHDYDETLKRMRAAIERGNYIKDTDAFKRTCKALGIKHTYKAIKEFIT